jgi:hypothetical protein
MTRVVHRLVGYDRQTDRMKAQFDIPDQLLREAKKIGKVPDDDPDAAWSYPLTEASARRLASLIGVVGPEDVEFYLEAFGQ